MLPQKMFEKSAMKLNLEAFQPIILITVLLDRASKHCYNSASKFWGALPLIIESWAPFSLPLLVLGKQTHQHKMECSQISYQHIHIMMKVQPLKRLYLHDFSQHFLYYSCLKTDHKLHTSYLATHEAATINIQIMGYNFSILYLISTESQIANITTIYTT